MTVFFKKYIFETLLSLEYKYNEVQFGIRHVSIEVSKQKQCISTSSHATTKLTEGNLT